MRKSRGRIFRPLFFVPDCDIYDVAVLPDRAGRRLPPAYAIAHAAGRSADMSSERVCRSDRIRLWCRRSKRIEADRGAGGDIRSDDVRQHAAAGHKTFSLSRAQSPLVRAVRDAEGARRRTIKAVSRCRPRRSGSSGV